MQSYIVIYRAGTSVQRLVVDNKIKSFPCWAHITGEYWYVKTGHTANQIYQILNPLVGLKGRVVVVALKRNAAWNNIYNGDYLYNNL
jgi:hypothetical protein